MDIKHELSLAASTSLIDKDIDSIERLRPDFVYNDYKSGTKVINTIINELNSCDEFIISVAFITDSGVTVLLNTFKRLEAKGVKGKILTSDYLNFNEASALRKLKQFNNLELKVCSGNNFHSKGYIFKKGDKYSFIVGSSNMTQAALTINNEWNIRLFSLSSGKLINDLLSEFNSIWNETPELTDEWLDKYEQSGLENYRKVIQSVAENIETNKEIKPNKMQIEALGSLADLRKKGKVKALIISATGTGKTYLSAFDVKQFSPKKMLFVIHREQIARDAESSYKRVLGEEINTAILSGNNRNIEGADFIFTTIQTLSRDNVLYSFEKDYFDYICIDEVHRAGAFSYQKILNYFTPKFTLGMSATPERTDGINIYEMFDYNIAYEIRLQKALEENMLCPFHYFGVTELIVDGVELDDESDFRHLTSKERVDHIIDKIGFYGYSGPRVRGLIFCSTTDECRELSILFNERGFQTTYLTGENTQQERESAIERLEIPFRSEEALDYIFTVDIFNEGVDIPKVNQIVMLRPTQSAIIFVQQLGRGLRLNSEKEYVVVIDFIANYKKNFLIPVALSGDKTYNKDTLRRFVSNGTSIIPGASTIHFDEISKSKIYESIDKTNFSTLTFLKKEYFNLKNKINKIPTIVDIYNHGSIDPELFFKHSRSYYNFLKKVEKDSEFNLDDKKIKTLQFLSSEVANGKRIHEILILRMLHKEGEVSIAQVNRTIYDNFNRHTKLADIHSAINVLNSNFQTTNYQLGFNILDKCGDTLKYTSVFKNMIRDSEFKYYFEDLIEYSYLKYINDFSNNEVNTNFVLYQKYSRKDALKILNWDKDESSTVFGYRIKHNTCPIFVTYNKSHDISDSIKYKDNFIDHITLNWMSKNNRTLHSPEIKKIFNYKREKIKFYLFIKKNENETDFYYLGQVEPIEGRWFQTTIKDKNGKDLPIVNFHFKMLTPVRDDIYNYFIEEGELDEEDY